MKKTTVFLLAVLFFLLCGCTESEIACGIDTENQAFLRYNWNLDLTTLSIGERMTTVSWLRSLADALKDKGFTVEHNAISAGNTSFYLRAELLRRGADREEAMALLREMLTDETYTPFTAVVCESLPQPLLDSCRVSLRLEPDRILDTTELDSYPERLRQRIQPGIEAGTIRVTLSLPATELPEGETAQLENGIATKLLNIPLTQSGELSLSAIQYSGNFGAPELWWTGTDRRAENASALERRVQDDVTSLKTLESVCTVAAGGFAVLTLLLFFLGVARCRRGTAVETGDSELPKDLS